MGGPPLRIGRRAFVAGAASALVLPTSGMAAPSTGRPVAQTRYGRVRGLVQDGIKVFKGIRYGADTAPRRFMPPLPPESWRGVAEATEYGPASPQRGTRERTSEDCLFLNVWTPALRDGRRRPVMVYFHGGAHASGSGSSPLYDGARLGRRGDVVVVTVNHRLNVFGYGYFARFGGPELADSGNVGNLDLILALQWVRDNIAEFGGDPANVTIFGQSGGGAKVVTLMAMPVASGLFHKAATMSGQHVTVMGPRNATRRARAVLDALGIAPDRIDLLRSAPAARLVEALDLADPILGREKITFWSVLDARSTPNHPFYPTAPRLSAHIPMIIGNTHDETRAFLGGDPRNHALSWADLPGRLEPEMVADIDRDLVVRRYRELYPDYTPSEVFFAATTAGRSWRGHLIQAEERARIGAPAWMYQLDFPSPAEEGRLRAFHSLDIALVFDNIAQPGSQTGTGAAAQAVADRMSASFIALARTGDPNHGGMPAWPKYELPERRTMIFDAETRVVADPRREERELFATVPYLKPGT
jgi:para-nitrobenzyl esterase